MALATLANAQHLQMSIPDLNRTSSLRQSGFPQPLLPAGKMLRAVNHPRREQGDPEPGIDLPQARHRVLGFQHSSRKRVPRGDHG
jgi:hypothetical protein